MHARSPRMLPAHIGRYEIQRPLGKGGMTSLYLAREPELDRLVVIKLFKEEYSDDREFRERFAIEARALVRLQHPNILSVYQIGEHEGHPFLAMEYIDGETLRHRLARTPPLKLATGLKIVEDLCAGLASAHDAGIVHGDIKPDNILIDRQGVVKVFGFSTPRNVPATIVGNYSYLSPEQLLGETVDKRSDLFAVGIVLYEVIAQQPPFPGDFHAAYHRVLTAGPVPLEERVPDVDPALVRIVMRALERNPGDRYQDAHEMRQELSRARLDHYPDEPDDAHATVVLPAPSAQTMSRSEEVNPLLDENVQFTVFRPKVLAPAVWDTMLVFAHLSEPRADAGPDEPHPLEEVERQAEAILGTLDAHGRQTVDSLESVPRDGELTLVPHAEGITFNPPSRRFTWKESVHREEFRIRADAVSSKETIRGRLSVYLGSLVIAEVGLIFKIGTDSNSRETVRDIARRYRNIFASYSHLDEAVVAEFSDYARAMGDRYLRDVIDLRAGERWQTALEDLIRRADVFQLFWSWNALASPHVRHEWQYALSLQRASFIRPVYWDDPLPSRGDLPPAALSAIHFERIQPRRPSSRGPSVDTSMIEPLQPSPAAISPVPMAPGSSRDPDTGTMNIPVAKSQPQPHASRSSGRSGTSWRIIGSIAAGIVLFVVGTRFWLGGQSSPGETPPASVGSPSNPTPTPPAPQPPSPVPPSPGPPDQAKAPPRPPAPASAPVRLTIRILAFDAKTAAKVEAKVVEVNSGRPVSDGVANDSGTIVLDRVPRGRYRLVVSAPGHRDVVRDVRIDADQTLEIDLEAR